MSITYDIDLFKKIRDENKINNMSYIPNVIEVKKTGPKQREITRATQIKGDCISEECKNQFNKPFRDIVEKTGPYCKSCVIKNGNNKRENTCKELYGHTHVALVPECKEKKEITNEERYGNKHAIASTAVRNKITEAFESKYDGATNPSQIQEVQENKKQTLIDNGELVYSLEFLEKLLQENNATLACEINELKLSRGSVITFICKCGISNDKSFITIKKYGSFCESCQDIHEKEKTLETNMRVRGVPHSSNDPEVIAKIKSSCIEKYGTDTPQQLEEIKQKTRDTCQKNLGVDYPQQSIIVKETTRLNNQEKYGVDHPMHVPEIADRCSKNAYAFYDYTFPSGRIDRIQGTEKYTLDHLLYIGLHEDDIVTSREDVPEIWWCDKTGKRHRYYIDTYIKSKKLLIESKSTWTAEKNREEMFLKQNAAKQAGYTCEIWVYDGKGNKIEIFK
jgi:hypothetical protein